MRTTDNVVATCKMTNNTFDRAKAECVVFLFLIAQYRSDNNK